MNRSPDVELVLRAYFADDSSSAPDHVLDAIEERIMHQPQRRAWRVSWRDFHVNGYLKPLLAVAAIVVVAVAGFAILRPSGAAVGGPPATGTPTLSPAPSTLSAAPTQVGGFGGGVRWMDNGASVTTVIDAVASGATVTGTPATGTIVSTFKTGVHTVRVGCVARDGNVWAVVGRVEKSTLPGETAGPWSRVIVKEGSPQKIQVWLSGDAPAGTDCLGFLAMFGYSDLSSDDYVPVESGALVPPTIAAP